MHQRPHAKTIASARDLIGEGKLTEASTLLRQCLERDPSNAEVWYLMAQIARLAGDAAMALELIGTALGQRQRKAEFLIEKASILAALGRAVEARAICESGLDLGRLNAEAHEALGRFWISQGQLEKACQHLQSATKLHPEVAETFSILGHVLMDLGRLEEAEKSLAACLKIAPNHVKAIWGLGNLFRQRAQTGQAIERYQRALALNPGESAILSNLGNTWLDLGEHEQAISCYQHSLRQNPRSPVTHSNFLAALHYPSGIDPGIIASAHCEWAKLHCSGLPGCGVSGRRAPSGGRRLRLGLVSADFRQHPVGRVAEVLARYLNRGHFEFYVYDNGTQSDQTTASLQSLVSNWRKIRHLSDDAAAKLIFEDGMDILVDLSGHTGGHRLLVFGRLPAPMQVSMFAYPNTTGLEAMHYRITDLHSDPPGRNDQHYTEKLVRLEKIAWACMPPLDAPEPERQAVSVGEDFVFGCLNNPSKISASCAEVWSAILRACPSSRLMLLIRNDPEHERRLREKFGRFGVRTEQLWFVPQTGQRGYLEYHWSVDLMLDPFPYNGGVTTWDALWMGVPVLTLAGDTYVSRQGVGLLSNIGLTDYIAGGPDELVAKAVASSQAGKRANPMRRQLQEQLRRSPLFDFARYGTELGETLRRLSDEHQST